MPPTSAPPLARLLAFTLALATLSGGCGDDPDPVVDPWGEGGFVAGEPLAVAPEELETWVYVPFEEMRCGDGTTAGIFVNFTDRSRELVLFLQGGGICYDALSCAVMEGELAGLGADPLADFLAFDRSVGIFDRDDSANPFRDASFVSVPHCTGDFHLADRVNTYSSVGEVHQRGHANLKAVVRRVVPAFADATRITLAGFSAGGVGATANYPLVASAFGTVSAPLPFLIDDAGPLLRPEYLAVSGQETIAEAWGLEETLFPWCPRCESRGFHEALARAHELHPGLRSSLLCTYQDGVVKALYTLISGASFASIPDRLEEGLLDLSEYTSGLSLRDGGRQREFYYEGTRHGAIEVAPLADTPGLASFLRAQLEDDGAWETIH